MIRRMAAVLAAVLMASVGLVACGGDDESPSGSATTLTCPTENTKAFPKTRFVADVGLIAGSFHHWIWKPYRQGRFQKGADGRTFALVKAGAASLLIAKLTKNAVSNVKASPSLCNAIGGPLQKLSNAVSGLGSRLRSGDFSSLATISGLVGTITGAMSSSGLKVTETHQ
ncbi:hypothetical protein [Nocardioides sp. KR10-350]|uniref:hypothetical protein n=1 Tax=Nocardioides cheoyonin TaxID=3156615 RepID=UPI0032B53FB6